MPSLSSIVNVTVTANTKTVARVGFGVPMLLAYHTRWTDRYRIYSKSGFPSNMTDDGFTTSDNAYQMAQAVFSQSPSPTKVVIGRRSNAWTQTVDFTPAPVAAGHVHSFVVTNSAGSTATITVTEGAAATVAALTLAFTTAVNATSLAITATDNTTKFTVAADVAGTLFSYTDPTSSLTIEDVTVDAGVAADLAAVVAAYSDFYGVALDSQAQAENLALAAAIEALKLIFIASGFSDSNGDSGSTTDEAATFQTNTYERSAFLFSRDTLSHPGAAWLGRCLPSDPGSITWAFKSLTGVATDDLSETFETAVLDKNGNTYTAVAGQNITYEGSTGGSYLDITRTKDWAEARVKESVFGGLVNADKIPFTDKGGATIQGLVLAALNQGVKEDDSGAFTADPAPYCIVPAVADLLAADKAARNFVGIEWGATLTGAVHSVTINGTLSLA